MNKCDDTLLTTGQAAALLDVPRWKLAYLIERGAVTSPSAVVPGRRLFTTRDIEQIRKELAALDTKKDQAHVSTPSHRP